MSPLRPEDLTNEEMLAQAKHIHDATCAILEHYQQHLHLPLTDGALVYGLVWVIYEILSDYHPPTDIAGLIDAISDLHKEQKLN